MADKDGTGPGGHPGVKIVPLSQDIPATEEALTAAFAAGFEFKFSYEDNGFAFAVFVNYSQ